MTLEAQIARAEQWYDDMIAYGNASNNGWGLWERQQRFQRIDGTTRKYFQGYPTHNWDDYPYHVEETNDDKYMQRLTDTPNYQNFAWTNLWPELSTYEFPFNMWCDQYQSNQTFGYLVHLQFQYTGRDAYEEIRRMDILYDGAQDLGGERKSGWYDPNPDCSLWSERTETQYGYRKEPDMGRIAHWRWKLTELIELYHHPTNGVVMTLSGTHGDGFFDYINIDNRIELTEEQATRVQARINGRRVRSETQTSWTWRVPNPFGDETLHEVIIE